MRGGVSSNASQILQRMRRRKAAMVRELSAGARELAPELRRESRQILSSDLYSVEVPFKKRTPAKTQAKYAGTSRQKVGGKLIRQWERSGNLGRMEQAKAEGPHVVMFNNATSKGGFPYPLARYKLGTSGGRQIRTPRVKSIQWHHEAIRRKRTRIVEVRRRRVLRALGA